MTMPLYVPAADAVLVGPIAPPGGCVCPNDDWWQCINKRVYGPCSDDHCGGVCSEEGLCPCAGCHGPSSAAEVTAS
uniref:hypothetical protein n=1 Tax=Streptosporangium sp. CA-235898 TaxID=3240073 RepID=UPI003F491AF0